jgi:hypothetical protein
MARTPLFYWRRWSERKGKKGGGGMIADTKLFLIKMVDTYLEAKGYELTHMDLDTDYYGETQSTRIYQRHDWKTTADAPLGFKVRIFYNGEGYVMRITRTINGVGNYLYETHPIEDVAKIIAFLQFVTTKRESPIRCDGPSPAFLLEESE